MAKKGMKRPEVTHTQPKNDAAPVQEILGKAKHGNVKANPIVSGTGTLDQKVYHGKPHREKPISGVYSAIDTDLARDNLENDITAADREDL